MHSTLLCLWQCLNIFAFDLLVWILHFPQVWARPKWRVSKVVTAWVSKMRLTPIAKTLSFKCGKQLLRLEIPVVSLNFDFSML